ncbi:MAG: GNAT family N-acetyltransferase [Thermoflexales bacterium]|nr:GNAT family N-acetyltransferase [Thermoflexales bacterium]
MLPQLDGVHSSRQLPDDRVRFQVKEESPCLSWAFKAVTDASVVFMPASRFSWEELTGAYNQTRVDYIVPMPMSVGRLREYARNYDIDLDASVVAIEAGQILGLAMLGVRRDHTWPTRLGVLPISRQRGLGRALMAYLLDQSCRLGAAHVVLEVIQGNAPAHALFTRLGFRETRPLLILRRPPGRLLVEAAPYAVQSLDQVQIAACLERRSGVPSWLDETPSLHNMGGLAGLRVELAGGGGAGWIVYQDKTFQLSHLVLETEAGDPTQVGRALLHALHTQHPAKDTNTENVPLDDPHLPAMKEAGYLESFGRIEMRLDI